jgi:hypothetical protein
MSEWPASDVKAHATTLLPESMVHLNEGGISSPVALMMPPVVMLKVPEYVIVDSSISSAKTENEPFEPIVIEPLSHQEKELFIPFISHMPLKSPRK